jgi:hypothetical protein
VSTEAHVFVVILTVVALLFILRLVRTRKLKAKYSLLWLTLGAAMVVSSIVPGVLDRSARALGVYYQPALYLLLGLVFLLLVVVHFSYELSRMENRVRTLAEEVTLLRRRLEIAGEGRDDAAAGSRG